MLSDYAWHRVSEGRKMCVREMRLSYLYMYFRRARID